MWHCIGTLHERQKENSWGATYSYSDQESLSTPGDIANVGERFLLKLYGAIISTSLDKRCYIMYTRSVSRSSLSSEFIAANCRSSQVSYRAYIAVQQWIRNNLCPTDWGWQYSDGSLVPHTVDRPVAPVSNRVVQLQDRLSEDMRMPEGRVVGAYCSPCAVTVLDKHAATFMR